MDIELARTFVEVVSTGSFVKAAENLHVAQTTVSARMRLLEQQLRRPLFVRSKAGAILTPAGEQFLRFAPTFVQLWRRAQQQVAVPEEHRAVITVGSEVSLWKPLLVEWVISMQRSHPDIALRVHVDVPQDLITHVAAGFVDIAVVHTPQHRPGLAVNLLTEEELVLVTTNPKTNRGRRLQYVHVEWSADFSQHYAESFPEKSLNLVVNLGPLALDYILTEGGSGYFRMNVVRPYLESGALHLVTGAPCFSFPIYVVHSVNADADILDIALTALRVVPSIEMNYLEP
jgi:DNA-binding transcriptional LysR family regulator